MSKDKKKTILETVRSAVGGSKKETVPQSADLQRHCAADDPEGVEASKPLTPSTPDTEVSHAEPRLSGTRGNALWK